MSGSPALPPKPPRTRNAPPRAVVLTSHPPPAVTRGSPFQRGEVWVQVSACASVAPRSILAKAFQVGSS
jgi:hypothetical protein